MYRVLFRAYRAKGDYLFFDADMEFAEQCAAEQYASEQLRNWFELERWDAKTRQNLKASGAAIVKVVTEGELHFVIVGSEAGPLTPDPA